MKNIPAPSIAHISTNDIAALLTRFHQVRALTLALAAPLSVEDMSLQSMPDTSPTKWHLAHTSWFFETFLLAQWERNFTPFHPDFKVLFNSYYNGVGEKHPRHERGLISRPDVATVINYRKNITDRMDQFLRQPALSDEAIQLAWLGCNHEEQHQELLLTDIKHLLSKNPAKPAYQTRWPLVSVTAQAQQWINYAGGLVDIGHDVETNVFAFDNESPRHKVWLDPFEMASLPVTYGQYAAFVDAGGYQTPDWWLSLGWDWVVTNKVVAPLYWHKHDNQWRTFTLHGIVPIEANTPVCHLNYFEADAFARWLSATSTAHRGVRLPTEQEWEFAAATNASEAIAQANLLSPTLNQNALHPLAPRDYVDAHQPQQLFGDVWEWTQSPYAAYPRFHAAVGAVGEYNGKFMCNQYVLRGGSCVTPRAHIRATYRNFFPPDARWQFSGLRLARG
jgi:ergothioneine biosynthesis protein EgtB